MEKRKMEPARLTGEIELPPSKSVAHRMILCAALARGKSRIGPLEPSRDIQATLDAVCALGVEVRWERRTVSLDSTGLFSRTERTIHCGESGSTLRFLLPIAALSGDAFTFTGEGRLPQRPIGVYADCLPGAGVALNSLGGLPLTIHGRLRGGKFVVPGDVSSQFVTGLLLALPNAAEKSKIILSSPLQSRSYVDLTLSVLKKFGVRILETPDGFEIPGNQRFLPGEYEVEGDWSQAAFFLAAGALGGELTLKGLRRDSAQGDRAAEEFFRRMGARTEWRDDRLFVTGGALKGIEIDATDIPDLVPVLAVTAACAEGRTKITGAGRLRIKESDRLHAVAYNLKQLGITALEREDGLLIEGGRPVGGETEGFNDHRIVMAMAVAALGADSPVTVTDARSVEKSYPEFFREYNRLGGKSDVL